MISSQLYDSVASPPESDYQAESTGSSPSSKYMKTVGFIFGYILSIILLFGANMLVKKEFSSLSQDAFSSSDAALISFTAIIPFIIELPKRTKENLYIFASTILLCITALFTYCGLIFFEETKQKNFFSVNSLEINIILIVIGLGIGIFYCKEND